MDVFELKADVSCFPQSTTLFEGVSLTPLKVQSEPVSDHEEPADPRSKAPLEGTSEDAVRRASPLSFPLRPRCADFLSTPIDRHFDA